MNGSVKKGGYRPRIMINPVYLGLKKKRWFTQGKWLIIKWYQCIDGKIICEGERTWLVTQMTKVGTLGRCHLPQVWLFPHMCRVEGNLEGEGDRLFYLLLSFSHARTVPWSVAVEGQRLQPVSWQPAAQRCLPSSSLVCLLGASYQPLPALRSTACLLHSLTHRVQLFC